MPSPSRAFLEKTVGLTLKDLTLDIKNKIGKEIFDRPEKKKSKTRHNNCPRFNSKSETNI